MELHNTRAYCRNTHRNDNTHIILTLTFKCRLKTRDFHYTVQPITRELCLLTQVCDCLDLQFEFYVSSCSIAAPEHVME